MLFPQFTIRNMLFLTAICAVISLFIRQAYFGAPWAIGLCMGLVFLAGTFLLHSLFTLVVGLPAYGWQRLSEDDTPSDLAAADDSVQQIIAQREGD